MAIIKVEIRLGEVGKAVEAFRVNRKKALEDLAHEFRTAVSTTVNELLKAEIDVFLGQPDQKDNKRNGYHPEREYILRGIGGISIRTPKDRKGRFESNVVPAHERFDPRIRANMAVLHLAGLCTRTLSMISKRLLGVEVSRHHILVAGPDCWRGRKMAYNPDYKAILGSLRRWYKLSNLPQRLD
jgi:transposase-like protein